MPRMVNGPVIDQIGQISKIFGDKDIAIADLRPGIKYSWETFSGDNEPENPACLFRGIKGISTRDGCSAANEPRTGKGHKKSTS